MTKKELSQLYYLNKEITAEKQRLAELEALATNTSSKISGLPHINSISDKTAIAAQIADIKIALEAKIQRSIVEYKKLSLYITTINDSLMRQILTYRFIDGLSWVAVALKCGGGNTASGCQMAFSRFLKKLN